jgi:hypothetical protein
MSRGVSSHPCVISTATMRERRNRRCGLLIRGDSLQHFAEDQVGEAETPAGELAIEPISLRRRGASEVVDSDGCVDDDHD